MRWETGGVGYLTPTGDKDAKDKNRIYVTHWYTISYRLYNCYFLHTRRTYYTKKAKKVLYLYIYIRYIDIIYIIDI